MLDLGCGIADLGICDLKLIVCFLDCSTRSSRPKSTANHWPALYRVPEVHVPTADDKLHYYSGSGMWIAENSEWGFGYRISGFTHGFDLTIYAQDLWISRGMSVDSNHCLWACSGALICWSNNLKGFIFLCMVEPPELISMWLRAKKSSLWIRAMCIIE